MNRANIHKLLTFSLSFLTGIVLSLSSFQAVSEDIDIFSVDLDQSVNKPNVLIVLDNSANWSRQAQHWPDGTQGQSEVRAIKQVINGLPDNSVNVGLMLYRTDSPGGGSRDDAYIRYHINPMNATNKSTFSTILTRIEDNIEDPLEKRDQSNPFGNLFWEVYNYFAGIDSNTAGASTPSSLAHGAGYDSTYDNYRSPLATTDTCTRTIVIFIANNTSGPLRVDSQANMDRLEALGGAEAIEQIPFATYSIQTSTGTDVLDFSTSCYDSASACSSGEDTICTLNATGYDECRCDDVNYVPQSCGIQQHFTVRGRINQGTETSSSSESPVTTTTGEATKCQNNSPGAYTCPSDVSVSSTSGDQTTVVTTSWSSCFYDEQTNACGNNNNLNKSLWTPKGTKVVTTKVYDAAYTDLAPTAACYDTAASCTSADFPASCGTTYDSCACTTATDSVGCPSSGNRYQVLGDYTKTEAVQDEGSNAYVEAPAGPFMTDEWARFLHQSGVPIPGTSPTVTSQVTTYTIDVFKDQQNPDHSALLFNTARVGGGKYFQAKDEQAIVDALTDIFAEVQSVNTAFSSASLPVNATNRAQNENQVFIGLFRPDKTKKPVWFGNLKKYQLIANGPNIVLGDKNGIPAINPLTGFITDCAVSFWTSDSDTYWFDVKFETPRAIGECGTVPGSEHSDLPDGPFVEKGATAEVQRRGNAIPEPTPDADGNFSINRNMETLSGSTLVPFEAPITGLSDALVNYTRGEDHRDEDLDAPDTLATTEPRSSIHGDVVHSRPQPVNYGGATGIVVFYGANDGTYRAVNASTGVEMWSFVAPEHYSKLARLSSNTDLIAFYGDTGNKKDYFFDGSTGIFQNLDNSKVYIYPSMRRGGRMNYAFNVTDPANPAFLWKVGCPNMGNNTGCTSAAFEDMGQSWAQPNVAFTAGHAAGATPIVALSGGYDACEDDDSSAPSCGSTTGSGVYILNAEDGTLLKHFDFNGRSVAADVAFIDINQDELVDFAYAVDTGGSIYRMDFVDSANNFAPITVAANWTFTKVASTAGDGRKFLFPASLFQATSHIVYLAIGSGDREHPLIDNYPYTDPVLNRFYVFKDDLYDTDASTTLDLDNETPDANGKNFMQDLSNPTLGAGETSCDVDGVLPNDDASGWFINLNEHGPGEQVVTSAVIASGLVFFSTNRATLPSTDACTNSLGEARGYIVNLLNGSGAIGSGVGTCGGDRSSEFVGGGLPPSPVLSTVPVAGKVRTIVIGGAQKDGTVSSAIDSQDVDPIIAPTRRPVYWFKSGDTD